MEQGVVRVNMPSGHQHYVLTEDLHPLMHGWCKRNRLKAPGVHWFARNHQLLRKSLSEMLNVGDDVVMLDSLPYTYMSECIQAVISEYVPKHINMGNILSADTVYLPNMGFELYPLEINRMVNLSGEDIKGRYARSGFNNLKEQIISFGQEINEVSGFSRKIIIIDDGIWTGETIKTAVDIAKEVGLEVIAVVVGVSCHKDGALIDLGLDNCDVRIVNTYGYSRPVVDWVCERDFFVGTPYGGRTVVDGAVITSGLNVGAYYVENKKWLKKWGSVADNSSNDFAKFCLHKSRDLYVEIEMLSKRKVNVSLLERIPLFIHNALVANEITGKTRVVDAINNQFEKF